MERARLGKEVRAVWDKLRATLLELEQEALLQDLAQERLETREERRARAQNRVRGGGASASRSRSREASTDKESKPRSGPPLGVPSAAMYKRGRGDGPSMRGSLREQARSASRGSQDREGPRSSRDLGAGAQRQSSEARGQDKDEGHGMMSWVVDAVDPTQFRSLLLQNLVRKLRLRHGLVALCAYAQVSAVAVADRGRVGSSALGPFSASGRVLGDVPARPSRRDQCPTAAASHTVNRRVRRCARSLGRLHRRCRRRRRYARPRVVPGR